MESEPVLERTGTVVPDGKLPFRERVVGIDPGLQRDRLRGGRPVAPRALRPRGRRDPPPPLPDDGPAAGLPAPGHREVLEAFPPGAVALERVHSHVRYPRTAILMGHARGVIVLAAASRDAGLRLRRHPGQEDAHRQRPGAQAPDPARHHDRARLDRLPEPHDVADACALALCHFQVSRNTRGLAGF